MSKRIFLIALLGGALSAAAAYYPLYRWLPGQFVTDWLAADERLALTGLALTLFLWLLTGAFAARQSGTRSRWAAAGAGALAGLIAAWFVEIVLGGAAAGVWGSRLMLMHGIHATRDETEFIYLLSHGVSSIIWGVHVSIWAASGLGALLGALGGWVAGPGGKPAQKENAFWLMLSALVTTFLSFALLVMADAFATFPAILQNAADKAGLSLLYPAESAFGWPIATHLVWLLCWQFFAWRLTRNAAPLASLRLLRILGLALLVLILIGLVYPLLAFPLSGWMGKMVMFPPLVEALILLMVAALLNWLLLRLRLPKMAFPSQLERPQTWLERLIAFLRRLGEARLAAWYFFLLSLLTSALTLLITRESLARHLWLPFGLGLGVLLGGLGVWETRAKAPPETGDEQAEFAQKDYFALGGLSGLFAALFTGLGIQTPLSLVLIPIVLVAPLSQHTESAALAATDTTLLEVVRASYLIPAQIFLGMLFFTLVYAMLFRTAAGIFRALQK